MTDQQANGRTQHAFGRATPGNRRTLHTRLGLFANATGLMAWLAVGACGGDDQPGGPVAAASAPPSMMTMPATAMPGSDGLPIDAPQNASPTPPPPPLADSMAPGPGNGPALPDEPARVPMADGGAPDGALADAGPALDPPLTRVSLETIMENPGAPPWFNVYRPSDLSATSGPLPVIVWANGGCFRSDFTWEPLFQRWAAAGIVVLALTESATAGALTQTNVADHGAMIDWALSQSGFAGMLDGESIIAAGNSCGGITALGLAAEDDRVAAVFVLSGSSNVGAPNLGVIGAIDVPVGYVVGGPEDIAAANAKADYEALSAGVPAMVVSRASGDHRLVSTDAAILPEVAEIALNWIDLALHGRQEAYDALTSADVCERCTPGDWSLVQKDLDALLP